MTTRFLTLGLAIIHVALAEDAFYDGYERDRVLIRSTYRHNSPVINASSAEACLAEQRIFKNIKFVGLSRERVLTMLGDPKTISDYGIATDSTPDSPLTYRFDSGFGGWDYIIRFQNGVVTGVDHVGLN